MVDFRLVTQLFEKLESQSLKNQALHKLESNAQSLNLRHSYVVFAESLTAGLISSEFSKIPGSSRFLWGGFVVYTPIAKEKLLGVPRSLIEECGVVSEECALSMAEGALKVSFDANQISPKYSLAVTGVAGPPSQFDEKKVGTVYIAVAKILNECLSYSNCSGDRKNELKFCSDVRLFNFEGNRNAVREQTLNSGIKMLINIL